MKTHTIAGPMIRQTRVRFPSEEELAEYYGTDADLPVLWGIGHLAEAVHLVDGSLLSGSGNALTEQQKRTHRERLPYLRSQLMGNTPGVHDWFTLEELEDFTQWLEAKWQAFSDTTQKMRAVRDSRLLQLTQLEQCMGWSSLHSAEELEDRQLSESSTQVRDEVLGRSREAFARFMEELALAGVQK